jgi:hypothetical protein
MTAAPDASPGRAAAVTVADLVAGSDEQEQRPPCRRNRERSLVFLVQGGNADAEELRHRNAREGQPHRLHRGW